MAQPGHLAHARRGCGHLPVRWEREVGEGLPPPPGEGFAWTLLIRFKGSIALCPVTAASRGLAAAPLPLSPPSAPYSLD